jgi:prepilin-type N-terminal cleavage/methylation domain-containing protein/prepilin-type processing-associated H-X9-DG protein
LELHELTSGGTAGGEVQMKKTHPDTASWGLAGARSAGRAFTLIEVLVVVAIIALLLAILLPSLGRARDQAKAAVCLNNLHQMTVATQGYATTYAGFYPPSQDSVTVTGGGAGGNRKIDYGWDVTRVTDTVTGRVRVLPGLVWQGRTIEAIHQCPSFSGPAMWANDRYTGYNYNSSYVGTFRKAKGPVTGGGSPAPTVTWVVIVPPARQEEIRTPARCAVFGDGQYVSGANKFMRSPWGSEQGARDAWVSSGRGAGTQGYRHCHKTNVAFADGHAQSWALRYTDTYDEEKAYIGEENGFLSPDNSLYALR